MTNVVIKSLPMYSAHVLTWGDRNTVKKTVTDFPQAPGLQEAPADTNNTQCCLSRLPINDYDQMGNACVRFCCCEFQAKNIHFGWCGYDFKAKDLSVGPAGVVADPSSNTPGNTNPLQHQDGN